MNKKMLIIILYFININQHNFIYKVVNLKIACTLLGLYQQIKTQLAIFICKNSSDDIYKNILYIISRKQLVIMTQNNHDSIIQKLKLLDAQPHGIQLNYKSHLQFKSKTGGCISLLFYLGTITVVIMNIYYFISENYYIYDELQIKNDLANITLNREMMGLLITGEDQNGDGFNITYYNQQQYGLRVYVQHITNINGSAIPSVMAAPGQKYPIYDFTNFFVYPKNFDMNVSGRSDVIVLQQEKKLQYNRLGMIVKNISDSLSQVKKVYKMTAKFIFINNVTNPKHQPPVIASKARIFYIRDGIPLQYNQLQQLTLYFRKLFVQTDTNKFFLSQKQTYNSTFYDEQSLTSIISDNTMQDNWLVQIKIKRSLYTIKYQRYFKKFSTFLAQTFGVIGFLSILFIFYRGYNKWCFTQRQLAKNKNTHIFKYYYNLILSLKNISTKSSFAYSKFQQRLDIDKIIRKLDEFQYRLRRLQGRPMKISNDPAKDPIQFSESYLQFQSQNTDGRAEVLMLKNNINEIKQQLLQQDKLYIETHKN